MWKPEGSWFNSGGCDLSKKIPTEQECEDIERISSSLVSELKNLLVEFGCEVELHGSIGKKTYLKDSDMDIFVKFKCDLSRPILYKFFDIISKKYGKTEIKYTSLPYIRIKYFEIYADIVPRFHIEGKPDYSLMHKEFMNDVLTNENKQDIRLLKSILSEKILYGGEEHGLVNGYIIEVLIYYYKNPKKAILLQDWNGSLPDPLDENRNLLKSLTPDVSLGLSLLQTELRNYGYITLCKPIIDISNHITHQNLIFGISLFEKRKGVNIPDSLIATQLESLRGKIENRLISENKHCGNFITIFRENLIGVAYLYQDIPGFSEIKTMIKTPYFDKKIISNRLRGIPMCGSEYCVTMSIDNIDPLPETKYLIRRNEKNSESEISLIKTLWWKRYGYLFNL